MAQELECTVHKLIAENHLGGTVCPLVLHPCRFNASRRSLSQADEDALLEAAKAGNVKEVLRLLNKGVNKECKNSVRSKN